MSSPPLPVELAQLLEQMSHVADCRDDLPAQDTPLGMLTREIFANNWKNCCESLLCRTSILRVYPEPSPAPRIFRYEIDRPYKRKAGRSAAVETMPGPIRGSIHYRADLLVDSSLPHLAVRVDPDLDFLHPNCSRSRGCFVCLGELPSNPYPFPLDLLLTTRVYPILSYADRRPANPLDWEAAEYFALDPHAMEGLEPVQPLY